MAEIKKPQRSRKGNPPPENKPSLNLTKTPPSELTTINFKMSVEFKREFKNYATNHDMTMVALLQRCFAFYKGNHH